MDRWIMRNRSFEISAELSKLLVEQTEFLQQATTLLRKTAI